MVGKVILVGAGPGNPGLLTLRGKEAISQGDVVVYDRLVSADILAMVPKDREKINVGKAAHQHLLPQEEINLLLLKKAQEGKIVVRLKGGDPFLFGRGGEELQLLQRHNIPFEVVPGISSAIAVPAFGGIPVTHRDYASSLHIITAHAKEGKDLDIDFQALVRSKGTLVFFMAVSTLSQIQQGLLGGGMNPNTPSALIEQGTTPQQRRLNATVATMGDTARQHQLQSPALIVVGEVCALAEDFDWFQRLPLKGTRVLVTRPKEKQGKLSQKLRDVGACVVEYPCIETKPLPSALDQAVTAIADYACLCFTSPMGAEYFCQALQAHNLDGRYLAGKTLAVVGKATGEVLANYGLRADWIPKVFDGAHLGQCIGEKSPENVLLLRAKEGTSDLPQTLAEYQIPFAEIPLYETHYPPPFPLCQEDFDCACFTSASTVKGFVSAMGADFDYGRVIAFAIGRQTAQECEKHGMTTHIAQEANLDSLVECMQEKVGKNHETTSPSTSKP